MSGIVSKNAGRASGIVGVGDIGADAVDSANIADDAIDSEHYTDGSIDNAHIADDAIDSEHYADGSIDNAHIADDAIDSEHYADGSIDNAHIADDAIDSEHYAAGSIDEAHIADNAVSLAKMAGGTDGNIISFDASGDPVAIATGNDGQVLTSTGAGSPPAFEDAAGGGTTGITDNATESAITISSDEEVTIPKQPSFIGINSTTNTDVTGDATVYTCVFDSERFDQNADFDLTTFTAPVTGKYLVTCAARPAGLSGHTSVTLRMVTSNETYFVGMHNASTGLHNTQFMMHGAAVVDMDAADTLTLVYAGSGASKVMDLYGNASDSYTWLSGCLLH